jgi:hypothetical protein
MILLGVSKAKVYDITRELLGTKKKMAGSVTPGPKTLALNEFCAANQQLVPIRSTTIRSRAGQILENVSDTNDDASIAAIRVPLSQEASCGHNGIRCSKVTSIGYVKEVSAEL